MWSNSRTISWASKGNPKKVQNLAKLGLSCSAPIQYHKCHIGQRAIASIFMIASALQLAKLNDSRALHFGEQGIRVMSLSQDGT